jgi:hypothetical protein
MVYILCGKIIFYTTIFVIFSMWLTQFHAGSILRWMRLSSIWLPTELYVQACLDVQYLFYIS